MGLFKDCGCGCNGSEQKKKFMISLVSALVFFIVANPETFKIVRRVFGSWVSSATGYPTLSGLVLHSFVFLLIVWGMMNLKREKMDGSTMPPMMDSKMGGPPAAVPEKEAKKDGMLPPMPSVEQPVADVPPSFLLPAMSSPTPEPKVTQGTMSRVSNMLGGHDIQESGNTMAPAPPAYGGNWRQCSCGDGTQVMILK